MRKKLLRSICFAPVFIASIYHVTAQSNQYAEVAPVINTTELENNNADRVLWDIHFNYNTTAATSGDAGMAGACFYNNEYWVSRWASDTLYRFSNTGTLISEFVVPGLSGVRSLTSDANYIYAGNNTNTIYRIDPLTQTLSGGGITTFGSPVRFCTYDATLNAGTGGFWVGNFATDITSVSMTGATLSTVLAATHGLTGMYGGAVDNFTAGGPYLWIFNQSGANNTELIQLQLPAGTQTGLTHDVFSDVGVAQSLTSGLAGGAFISNQIVPGEVTLGGIVQGTPNNLLFGYELSAPPLGVSDMSANSVRTVLGYTQIPLSQVTTDSMMIALENNSGVIVDSVIVTIEIEHSSTVVHSEQIVLLNYPAYGNSTIYSQPFLPANGLGDYLVTVTTSTNITEPDSDNSNDTASFTFTLTDSIYARDNGIPDGGGGYAMSGTDWGYVVSKFQLFNPDTIAGVWIELAQAIDNDTTYAVLVNMAGGVPTGLPTATSPIQIISSGQFTYYLEFTVPVALAAGDYGFGCYEGATSTINLAQSNSVYTAGTNFFYITASGWTASGIATARFIHPIFKQQAPSTAGLEEQGESGLKVYPNPSNGIITIDCGIIENGTYGIADMNGRFLKMGALQGDLMNVDLSSLENGTYIVQIFSNGKRISEKTIIKN